VLPATAIGTINVVVAVRRARWKFLSIAALIAILCALFMSENRIDSTFARLRSEGRAGFIAYICAGDPTLAATRALVPALERAGVDIVEIGIPFSDPLADGVVNQLASARALASGTTLNGVLECVRAIRTESQIPIVFYTYMNPVYRHGFDAFLADAEAAGVDGVLFLDLPPDEDEASPELRMHGPLKRIRLIAPTTPPDRIALLTRDAGGFIYYVSREGVTGERSDVAAGLAESVAAIKKTTPLPVSVGFGIGTPEQVRAVALAADAVVVGSAIVKRIAEFGSDPKLVEKVAAFVKPLADAVRRG
jgi:tryptophan synthase alpha chain